MNEDMILPDDFEESLPLDNEIADETPVETDAQPQADETTEAPQDTTEPLKFKVKFNREEQELSYDEAVPFIQKGMHFDKVQERLQALESDPRLAFIENLANQNGMTADEYIQAVQQQQEQARIDELVQQGISEELASEMLENKKFRQQYEAEKQTKAQQEKQNAEYNEFFDYFKQANGRDFDSNKDQIPETVWQATQNGVPLKFAYMEHQNQQLQQQIQTYKQNETNANRAPVTSTTAHGGTEIASEDDFLAGFNSI
ncbi:hypothetical protein QNH20_18335 [Neobacillus sp. WH10]|uniref:hypothetical protein n=1 Tax=Neobacillus sp. WH10 TaxID=3047873 RepID=UPI0024C1B964|nr:hypothetical protein [Neobacillus sp. WH10]WHY76071.1 hypothetical protein QNH20_18335 [Neobacillus sp. WH10]